MWNADEMASYNIDYNTSFISKTIVPQLIESIASCALPRERRRDALGAGGRAFKSPRPDQWKTSALFAMSGFGRTSAPVAICGVLGFLEALNSYKFDYTSGWGG
jgi:hypothetical protein